MEVFIDVDNMIARCLNIVLIYVLVSTDASVFLYVTTVNGAWSLWSDWGTCSVTCDVGIQRRDRSCSNPYPAKYGDHCFGDSRDDRICMTQACTSTYQICL